ncbi:MAG: ABC transporter ATP-binding protein [Lachnospiraceae bacterium]|nr:ABC transporter ATP-binding protein [Lachnospiraceae bacterium]
MVVPLNRENIEKPKYSTLKNVEWMIGIAWKTRKRVLGFCLLTAVLEVLLNVTQLYVTPGILSKVEQKAPMGALLGTIGLFTAALFVISGVKEYVRQNTLFPRIDVRTAIIAKLAEKCNLTSYPNTLKTDFIKLREKAHMTCKGNDQAAEHIWETLTVLLKNLGGFAVYLTILSRMSAVLLLVVIGTCIAGFLVTRAVSNWRYAHRDEEERYYQKKSYLRGKAESVTLAKDIRIFGLQNWLNELIDQIHDLYLDFSLRCERVELLSDLAEAILTMARNGIAYVYLISLTLREGLSVSEFLLYFTAVTTFTTWIMGILQELSTLRKECLDISLVRTFLEYPEPFRFEEGENIPAADAYELRMEHVSYRYPGAGQDTLHDLTLTIRPGEKLAIVGLNGAGKTTLVKLLCGLLDPTEGCVLLNGQDIRTFNRRSYYDLFSAVFQEFSVLDVTVAEEIAPQTEGIDYGRIADCVEKAGLTALIEKLPRGLQTHVGREVYLDGVLFSGGETQRLMLARAVYKNGPILLLDEPTAALDPIAENDIYLKYNEMTRGKTSLFISHRLASTRFCDRILFVAEGGIREEGTHETLLAAGGEYAGLFEVQSRYYQEGKEF